MIQRIKIVQLLKSSELVGKEITLFGWVRSLRDSKNNVFISLNDGSCLANLQLFINKSSIEEASLKEISTGSSIKATGIINESIGEGQSIELLTTAIELIGKAPEGYPLQKKGTSMDYLRGISHLRGRTNTFGAIMRVRSSISYAIHHFFQERSFKYIHTPLITSSDAEGAGQMFQVTTLPLEKLKGRADYSRDFFGKKSHLTVSGQLAAESYAMSLGDVYTFGPTFRAENSNTVRHLAEFWMIEPEMAFCDNIGNRELAEEFLKYLITWLFDHDMEEMTFFDDRLKKGIIGDLEVVASSKFEVMSYTEAIKILEQSGQPFEFPIAWGVDMKSEHERFITEKVIKGPAIIIDYPKEIKSFYMKLNNDGKTVRGMDILTPGVGEIIGGSEREDSYAILLARMTESGLNPDDYRWYLDLRQYGSAPHSGFGLGLERFIMYVTGVTNMRDTIPFPRAPHLCDF